MEELTGVVRWFSSARGFGLITESVSGTEYYVIFEDIAEEPREFSGGERVRFAPATRGTSRIARNVRRER